MRNKTIFIKLVALFIVFFITPIIVISSALSLAATSSFKDEVSEASLNELSVIKNTVEIALNGVIESAIMVSINKELNDIKHLAYDQSIMDADYVYSIKSIMNDLSEVEKLNDRIHSLYLYNEETETILTSYNRYQKASDFDDMEWLSAYEGNLSKTWMKTRDTLNVIGDSTGNIEPSYTKVITFVYKLSSYTTRLKGAVVVNLYEDKMYDLLSNKINKSNRHLLIIDGEDHVISSNQKVLIGRDLSEDDHIAKIKTYTQEYGNFIMDIDGKSNLITYNKSELNGWTYISISNLNDAMTRLRSLGVYMIIVVCILIAFGCVVAYFVSQKIYNPVRQIIDNLRGVQGINIDESKDEMVYVSNAIDAVLKQSDQLRDLTDKRKRNARASYINGLLIGNANTDVDMESLDIVFDKDRFLCALLTIDQYTSLNMKNDNEQQFYLKSIVLNVLDDILSPEYQSAGVLKEKGKIAVVINLDSKNTDMEVEGIIEKIELFITTISKTMDFSVSVAIGDVYGTVGEVSKSYMEATEALKYRIQYGDACVIQYKKIIEEINTSYYYPEKNEIYLVNYLKAGQRQQLLDSINNYMMVVKEMKLSYDNTIQIFNQLLGNVIKYLLSIGINPNDIFSSNTTLYKHLAGLETIDEMRLWFTNIFICIMEYIDANQETDKNYIDMAKEYIYTNYTHDFDVREVVEYVGISHTHLRRLFADELGMSINSYINKLRIDEAKRLLKETDQSVEEIALMVGYNNNQSLNRFFKKLEGITPGAFRKIEG